MIYFGISSVKLLHKVTQPLQILLSITYFPVAKGVKRSFFILLTATEAWISFILLSEKVRNMI